MMIKQASRFVVCCCSVLVLYSCATPPSSVAKHDAEFWANQVFTQEQQDKLTPDDVIKRMKEGNQRFVADTNTFRNHSEQVRQAAMGQHPKGIVLSCIDSRVPVEDIFELGIGDIFVARVAGNFENTDILGSMEYACKVAGAKLVLVLGHEYCGAIKGAIDDVQLGNITSMLDNIKPAVNHFSHYAGNKTSENESFVHMVAEQNVSDTIDNIREHSPILREMEQQGKIKIVGGMYDMETGKVTFKY
ncbi:MAG TPA: carbonic anhydrase [Methyloprofundus sp.]|uniref:carbonic anhydrase family protein n=1 Tax=Methyloprofundus sp. TaxID=2020875 RepID=UPI0017C30068|nr:carbonic anhydrase family protein [Methyloprofundus sp.]HIG65909.1 carbonic anhydrase [Methyloprofundus sp.]HIL77646.1 carbonic anhydrase [Methylococcales bacterium]